MGVYDLDLPASFVDNAANGGTMGIVSWVIFGLVAGALAKVLMPGDDSSGILKTTGLGIVGALAGGFLGTLLGFGKVTGFNIRSFAIAIAGALLALWLYRVVKKS
jgi:uncharacterized membrane protein YeaQ/YmgE (transglycosylase-associated protein family)